MPKPKTNIPAFAIALASIPKRVRQAFGAGLHGRNPTKLIESAEDPTKFVGRLTKKGKGKYTFEAFDKPYSERSSKDAKIIAEGRVTTPLRGIGLARQFSEAHKAS